jgi:hypothetical protein
MSGRSDRCGTPEGLRSWGGVGRGGELCKPTEVTALYSDTKIYIQGHVYVDTGHMYLGSYPNVQLSKISITSN